MYFLTKPIKIYQPVYEYEDYLHSRYQGYAATVTLLCRRGGCAGLIIMGSRELGGRFIGLPPLETAEDRGVMLDAHGWPS
jgi:hypothetical protein